MEIYQDFKELLGLLNKNRVKYLVIGGYAVNFYGYPRYTSDLDLLVLVTERNANAISETLNEFGFSSLELSKNEFLKAENIIQLGSPPYRVDIMTSADTIDFEIAYKKRNIFLYEGIKIPFIDIESLIKNKLSTGRPQDLADADQLFKIYEEE